MKKWISVILAVVCALALLLNSALAEGPEEAEETARPWPVENYEGTDTSLKKLSDPDGRHQSYFGPDTKYHGDGAYKPNKVRRISALFREGNFVLADMDYQTAGRRILYFKASALVSADVETVTLTGVPAKTTSLMIAMQGPGTEYEPVMQTIPSPYADWTFEELVGEFGGSVEIMNALTDRRLTIYVDQGTEISVFFEMNGWVFAEFSTSLGDIRAWLLADYVEAE